MITIIGSGNVAFHLKKAFEMASEEVSLVNPHTLDNISDNTEVILISVSDDAIGEVVSKLPEMDVLIAHTSGSVPMSIINDNRKNNISELKKNKTGVFYPLQTFTKEISLDYKKIPVFLEGSDSESLIELKKLASKFSNYIYEADSYTRKKLHLASVFACNFTNALAGISERILEDTGIKFSVLLPLMHQTVDKLALLSPADAQTGPAVRGDSGVITTHLELLKDSPLLQEIYRSITYYIESEKNVQKDEI